MDERYFIDIRAKAGGYRLKIHRGDRDKPLLDSPFVAAPETRVGKSASLGALVRSLLDPDVRFLTTDFDERVQLDLGRYLYEQTFGQLDSQPSSTEGGVDLRIVTDDEHVARLPWVLLARTRFLSASGWSIALSRPGQKSESCLLPPSPRVLIAAPQPEGVAETGAAAHLEDLRILLASADRNFERAGHLSVATTWDDFGRLAAEIEPHVVYYYGHGEGDAQKTRLIFADGSNRRHDVPVGDVAQCLAQNARPPVLAYVNCCLGDAGGLLGAGWQLGDVVPAVVTNRTVAFVDAAQRQAKHFWRAVLLDGQAPHKAVSEMYGHLGNMGLSFRDARWMTPVLHCHYDRWESHPPKRQRIDDPHWHVKLDRVGQFGQVLYQTQEMLRNRKPTCLAYLWYGQEGQGMEHFHQRLKVELRDFLGEHHLYEVRPRWPDVLQEPYFPYFEDVLLEAFAVDSLDNVAGRIREQTRGEAGRDVVVYVRHEPVYRGDVMKPELLCTYLEWWDRFFAPKLRTVPAFGLLGTSFVVKKPAGFLKTLKKNPVEGLEMREVVWNVLDELERLVKKDLLNFLNAHNVALPSDYRDLILDEILERTEGHYEATLEELRNLVHRAWDERETGEETAGADVGDEDW